MQRALSTIGVCPDSPNSHKRRRNEDEADLPPEKKMKPSLPRAQSLPVFPSAVEEEKKTSGEVDMVTDEVIDKSTSVVSRCWTSPMGQVLQVRQGDITGECTDCIVNAANSSLAHGAGVAGAIRRAAGVVLMKESDKWIREKGEVPTGQVAWTSGGDLLAPYVIHAVGPIYRNGNRNEPDDLSSAVLNSFLLAHKNGWRSISIPAISSGIFGFPKQLCAKIMFSCLCNFSRNTVTTLLSRKFVLPILIPLLLEFSFVNLMPALRMN